MQLPNQSRRHPELTQSDRPETNAASIQFMMAETLIIASVSESL
ncbi:hypothetical protein COO91_10079 (plasmid) [Nostoc flagelliforme CCNUN1]|uniref:Uncharacterized protein n=1 Tax=Nostoc flagelliforme CCNUN1 TaxID=2038116 RepID=A0A2K8T860_9NOSO|nr:hypothetical protein [Nostoc flagelliforme]AUB43878.1 hypothetical protein COO91_10079 [Nostoc flagelliforme CCNUN1]